MVRAGLSGRTGQMLPSLLDGADRDPALDHLLRDYLRERSGPPAPCWSWPSSAATCPPTWTSTWPSPS